MILVYREHAINVEQVKFISYHERSTRYFLRVSFISNNYESDPFEIDMCTKKEEEAKLEFIEIMNFIGYHTDVGFFKRNYVPPRMETVPVGMTGNTVCPKMPDDTESLFITKGF
jgi:hypothetical protein